MAAHVMKMYSGRKYTYTYTLFARLGDILIPLVETGHMSCRANDSVHQMVANDSGHARGVAAMTSHVGPGVLYPRFCVWSITRYLQRQRNSGFDVLFFSFFLPLILRFLSSSPVLAFSFPVMLMSARVTLLL